MSFDFTELFMQSYGNTKEDVKAKKSESKKSEPKKEKKTKSNKPYKRDVTKGVKLFTLVSEPVELSRDRFSADQVDDSEVLDLFIQETGFDEYLGGRLTQLLEDVPNEFFVSYSPGARVSDLSQGQYKLSFAGMVDEFEVESSMPLMELREKFKALFPTLKESPKNFIRGGKLGDVQILYPEWEKEHAVKEVVLPIAITFPGRVAFTIDELEGSEENEDESDSDEDEKDADISENEAEDSVVKIPVEKLNAQIVKQCPEAQNRFLLMETTSEGVYLIVPSLFITSSTNSAPKKKEEPKFSTSSVLSIGYAEFQLEPDMFGGKKEVVAKELFSFLRKNGHIQFSDEKSEAELVKETNTIYVQRNGSRKGAFIPKPIRVELEKIKGGVQQNIPFHYDRTKFFLSANSVGLFAVSMCPNDGYFELQLPKIPGEILKQCIDLFRYMAFQYDKSCRYEVTCQIYFDTERMEYEVYVPEQFVSPITCRVLKKRTVEECKGKILVMDFHSHHIMAPFPSSIDNEDEIGCQLYAICGDMRKDGDMAYTLYVRAGAFGKWLELATDTVFEEPEVLPSRDFQVDQAVLIRTEI